MTAEPEPPTRTGYQHLLAAGKATAALLVLAAAVFLVVRVLSMLAPMTLAVIATLLLGALIGPVAKGLRHLHLPRSLAALTAVAGLLAMVGGASYLIGHRAASQLGDLQAQVVEGVRHLRRTLLNTLPGLTESRLDDLVNRLIRGLQNALPSPYAGLTSATEVLAAILLTIVLLFFCLRDGEQIWSWLVGLAPRSRAPRIDRAGRAAWHTLGSYAHGVIAVAAVDAVGIGAALFLLHVPLALSLTVLTFLSAFVPIVGATVAGVAATLVTLVTNGTRDALLILAAVILVQQVEGNLLQPMIMRRAVRLHPVVTLLAVTAGTLLAGITGAVIAVPACAVVYHAALGYRSPAPASDAGRTGSADAEPDDRDPECSPGGGSGTDDRRPDEPSAGTDDAAKSPAQGR